MYSATKISMLGQILRNFHYRDREITSSNMVSTEHGRHNHGGVQKNPRASGLTDTQSGATRRPWRLQGRRDPPGLSTNFKNHENERPSGRRSTVLFQRKRVGGNIRGARSEYMHTVLYLSTKWDLWSSVTGNRQNSKGYICGAT